MTKEELKAYIKSKANVEGEMLDELTKRIMKVCENSLFGMTKTGNIYSLLLKKEIEQLEEKIEKVLESNSRGRVKDYSFVLSENKDKREFHLQGFIELKWKERKWN